MNYVDNFHIHYDQDLGEELNDIVLSFVFGDENPDEMLIQEALNKLVHQICDHC